MIDESHDAAAEPIDDQENDARTRDLAKLFSQPEKLAELIGELKRKVNASNDPITRAVLQELEAAANMTAARRDIGVPTMHVDPRYPAPDVYAEAIALVSAVPPSAGYGVGADSEREWKRTLDYYEWHQKTNFLTASIEHCRWFSGHLLGEPGREKDAFEFRNLGDQLTRLERKVRRRAHEKVQTAKRPGRPRNKAVNGTVLKEFRGLFDEGKRSQQHFARRVLKRTLYAVKTAERGFASDELIAAYMAVTAPNGKKLKLQEIEKS